MKFSPAVTNVRTFFNAVQTDQSLDTNDLENRSPLIISKNLSRNFGVSNSKRAHLMVTIVKKREFRATPYVINEILRKFLEI